MRFAACVLAVLLCACGGPAFTVEPAAWDDGGQALDVFDGGVPETAADAGNTDLPDAPSQERDAGSDGIKFHGPDAAPDAVVAEAGQDSALDASAVGDASPEAAMGVCTPGAERCDGPPGNASLARCDSTGQWVGDMYCPPICTCNGMLYNCNPSNCAGSFVSIPGGACASATTCQ
jgi:hypothetical protein